MVEIAKPLCSPVDLAAANSRRRWLGGLLLALLFGAALLPGLFGRDPWKADEAYGFGLVLHMIETGDYVVPTLGGEPFLEKPPLLYIVGAFTARLCAPVLPLHDGARLAVLLFNVLTLAALGLAGRELYGRGKGWLAPVILIGCLGLVHHAHLLMTDQALLSGFALGLYGLALGQRRTWLGGALAGTGLGVAFMAKGLLGPGLLGLIALVLPIVSRSWRTRQHLNTLVMMGLTALPWLILWPYLLYARSPELFREWFWVNNLGRFMGTNGLGPKNEPLFYFRILPWFGWPALPLALLAWWSERRAWRTAAGMQLSLVSFGVMFVVLTASANARSLYAQPMLLPLALAGTGGVERLKPGWVRGLNRLNCLLAVVVVAVLGLLWLAQASGWPAWLWDRIHTRVPDFQPHWVPGLFAIGLVFAVGLLVIVFRAGRPDGRFVVINWAACLTGAYLLAMTWLLPLCDANMTYRHTYGSLRAALPADFHAVASQGLGEPQRALLHYYAGLKTHRLEVRPAALDDCELLLVQGNYRENHLMGPPERGQWKLLWERRHGGRESFRLYQRTEAGSNPRRSSP